MEENAYEKPHFWSEIGSGFENRAAHPTKIPRGTTLAPLPAETGNKEENL